MDRYRKRLARDLDHWIAEGLVPAGNRTAILNAVLPVRPAWTASGAAAILGAVLLGLAAISFTAANWADLPRLIRFVILIAALWASYAGAAFAFARGASAAGHGLALVGAALFGAAIALTAQTFNMSAFRNTGVLIWTVGAFVTALAAPSRPVLILAALLAAFWAALETNSPLAPPIIWGFGPIWLVIAAAAVRLRSLVSLNVLSAALLIWLAHAFYELGLQGWLHPVERVAVFALTTGAIAMLAGMARDKALFGAGVLTGWAAAGALAAAFTLQLVLDENADALTATTVDYAIAVAVPLLVFLAAVLLRLRARAFGAAAAGALALAAGGAAALPVLAARLGPSLPMEMAAGAAVYAVAASLILLGARLERRFVGGLGVALFIVQSLYVYSELFGDLLNTALFFLVGGLGLFVLSITLTRLQKRLARTSETPS